MESQGGAPVVGPVPSLATRDDPRVPWSVEACCSDVESVLADSSDGASPADGCPVWGPDELCPIDGWPAVARPTACPSFVPSPRRPPCSVPVRAGHRSEYASRKYCVACPELPLRDHSSHAERWKKPHAKNKLGTVHPDHSSVACAGLHAPQRQCRWRTLTDIPLRPQQDLHTPAAPVSDATSGTHPGRDFVRQRALDGFEGSREVPQPGGLLEDPVTTQLLRPFRNGNDHLTHVVDV